MEEMPPGGLHFHPTEEELVSFYLHQKLERKRTDLHRVIPVLNIYEHEPCGLPKLSGELCHGDKEQWFFFVPRQEREARGGRPSRLTASGYWKATGSPNYVYSSDNRVIGMKKTMEFYKGRAPSGRKTEWKMHEYKAIHQETFTPFGCAVPKLRHDLSLCRVYVKPGSFQAFDRHPLGAETKRSDTQQLVHGLTESVLSFDDPTRRKLLPDRMSLASLELTSLDFDDLDHCAAMLLDVNDEFGGGLSLSCGDERINISTTNHGDRHDAALLPLVNMDTCVHTSSTQPVALPHGGEIVQLESSEKNPWVDFDATNNRSHQSGFLVSNSENQKMREASKRRCMMESVLSLVDSKTRISSMDYDAPLNRAHLLKAHQSGPIAFNSEKKDTREELHRECLTETVLSLDDSTKQKALLDFDATEDKAHLFRAYQSGLVVSLSKNKSRGEALKRECITKNILSLEDLQEHCGDRCDDAAKTFGAIYDPGFHMPDSLARKSFEVLETLPTEEQPIDCVPLLAQGRLPLEGCLQQEKSPDLPRVMQINGVEQRVTKMPRYLGGLTDQSASSSRWPISLPDGGHIVLLDPLDQSTKNIEHVSRAVQCSPTVFLAEKKMVRKCRTMSVIFEENHLHFGRRCEGAAKGLGAMRICRKHGINLVCVLKRIHMQHGIHQWPFRQKWATMKGYSLGEESPFEVRRLSTDEKLDSRLQLIHMSQFARSSPRALALSDGGIVRPTALSSSEFAATNNRADLVGQDQSSSAASQYRCKNTRETSDKQGLEDLQQHFGCKHKYALKSLGVSGSMFKSTCRQHWFYWWHGRFKNNEQQAFDATSNRAHIVKADERGPTVSNALFLEDLRHQFGARCKDAAKGLHDSLAWKSFKVQDNLPLGEQSNTRRRSLMHKHCVRLKKSQDLPRSMLRDCAGGLAAQSDIGLPDGGHILSLSEKKIVRKTLKRECRTMSVLSLEDHQQHVGRRWEDTVKFLGAKRICRQLVIHRETTAKRIRRQLGTHRWLFKQSDIGLPDGGHILSLSEKKIVRKTSKRMCRSMSVLSLQYHQQHVGRSWEDAVKFLGEKRMCRQLAIHRETIRERIRRQLGTRRWPFKQSSIRLPDGGQIQSLSEKKIVRKTLKRKCRSMSVLSLEDHKQHVDRRWEDAAKSHGAKRIRRQLVIHRLSTAKRIHKQHGIHWWPFQRSFIGLPDGGHIPPLSETKILRKTLKRKCRGMSVLSLVDRQQHVDRRWEDAVKNIGAKRICRQLVLHRVSIAKRMCRQHGIYHRWPFQQDLATMKGYSLGDERPVEVISLSTHAKLVSRLQLIYISWLSRFSPWPSALAGGVEVGGPIALSLSESATTKNIAQRVGQDQSGSAASDTENERTREQEDLEEIYTSVTSDDLRRLYGRMNRKDAAASLGVSVATFKRKCREFGIQRWPHVRKKKVGRPPDQHGERNTSTACKMPLHNVHARMEGEPVGQNQEANEFRQDFMEHSIALNTENDSIIAVYSETEAARGSSKWAFQLEGETMQSTTYPYRDDLVFSQSQIASTEVVNENMGSLQDRRDLLASQVVAPQKEPLLEGHVFGFGNWTVGSCSDLASSQTMRTFSHATGSSENLENWLASVEEHLMEENVYVSSRSDPAPSQPLRSIHHTMATIPHMMPLPTERQDMRSVKLKATYGDTKIKFQFPLTSGINELKVVMSKILERELGSFKVEYKDEDGEWILMALDEHVREYLQLLTSLGNKVTELKVQDKVPNTMNFCGNCRCNNCRSLKRKRP
ncbi:uncharacterized protein LOC131325757 [Rhododendron vialii]|uniref:uncharacterized protein LOC131325757 n=1 Tax=Rhododendron vialii TaxID=182163 RepID=UPI00265E6E85|nr:uncharacterized protein LOC131325757 [Rhododendron vialii]